MAYQPMPPHMTLMHGNQPYMVQATPAGYAPVMQQPPQYFQHAAPMMFPVGAQFAPMPAFQMSPMPSGSNAAAQPAPPARGGASSRKKPILAKRFRTELCMSATSDRPCPYEARCMFAHSRDDLRTAEQNIADGLTTEDAIRDWKALDDLRRLTPQPPIVSAPPLVAGPPPGYIMVHPGQTVYLAGPDGALFPASLASLCWPNGAPLLPPPPPPLPQPLADDTQLQRFTGGHAAVAEEIAMGGIRSP